MWVVEAMECVPVELDSSMLGQCRHSITGITAGGIRLVNAIELVEFDSAATQVEICEECGIVHCSPGSWVVFRRIGESVVWLPAWAVMEKGEFEVREYRPPSYLTSKGAPIFGQTHWERLRTLNGTLPRLEEVSRITSREVARLCQLSAPGHFLGEFPSEPRVCRDVVLAVTEGDLRSELDAVDRSLDEHFRAVDPMDVNTIHAASRPIELWLDLPGIPHWKSLAHVDDRVCMLLNDTTTLVRGRAS
jgi:hypothetical protein